MISCFKGIHALNETKQINEKGAPLSYILKAPVMSPLLSPILFSLQLVVLMCNRLNGSEPDCLNSF